MAQPMLVDLSDTPDLQHLEELTESQNDVSIKHLIQKKRWHGFVKKPNSNIQMQPNVQQSYGYNFHRHI
ncbi:hypothetical protein TNCV_3463741 [Trichonephila clavipes]|nr:hypothetical protein TNCV_3463741 [Trichonephila clavipes]